MRTKAEIRDAIRGAQEEIERLEKEKVILDNKIRALRGVIAGYEAFLKGEPPEEHAAGILVANIARPRMARGQSERFVREALRHGCKNSTEIIQWVREAENASMTRPAVNAVLRRLLIRGEVVRVDGGYRLRDPEFAQMPRKQGASHEIASGQDSDGTGVANQE